MARYNILIVCIVGIALPSVFAATAQPCSGQAAKDDAIAKVKTGIALGSQLLNTSIDIWLVTVNADPDISSAVKECVKIHVDPVKSVVDAQIQTYSDGIVQQLSATPDAKLSEVLGEINKELVGNGYISDTRDSALDSLKDQQETCEELYDNNR